MELLPRKLLLLIVLCLLVVKTKISWRDLLQTLKIFINFFYTFVYLLLHTLLLDELIESLLHVMIVGLFFSWAYTCDCRRSLVLN